MAPFYAVGWLVELAVATLSGRPPDSYGVIPQIFFGIGALAFGVAGFWLTAATCLRLAPGRIGYLATGAIALGGPLVYYVFFHPTMAHASSFGLVSLLTFLWWRAWCEGTTTRRFAGMALLFGVLVTVRYQNVMFGVLPMALLIRELRRSRVPVVIRTCAVGLVASMLPVGALVLHYVAMNGLVWPGSTVSAGLYEVGQNEIDFLSPNFFNVLFSCRHGAFYWAPVIGIGFVGLLWISLREWWGRVFLLTFLGHVYLVGGLEGDLNWSGAASFGMRYLVECAPLLAAGLTSLVGAAQDRPLRPLCWRAPLAILVAWNLALILPYALRKISQTDCVPYGEMAAGVWRVITGNP
jgi:hypothetical protein